MFNGYHLFVDTKTVSLKPQTKVQTKYIPPQMHKSHEEKLEAWTGVITGVLAASYLTRFLLNLLYAGSLH